VKRQRPRQLLRLADLGADRAQVKRGYVATVRARRRRPLRDDLRPVRAVAEGLDLAVGAETDRAAYFFFLALILTLTESSAVWPSAFRVASTSTLAFLPFLTLRFSFL
jgi:hypothetical protein